MLSERVCACVSKIRQRRGTLGERRKEHQLRKDCVYMQQTDTKRYRFGGKRGRRDRVTGRGEEKRRQGKATRGVRNTGKEWGGSTEWSEGRIGVVIKPEQSNWHSRDRGKRESRYHGERDKGAAEDDSTCRYELTLATIVGALMGAGRILATGGGGRNAPPVLVRI